LLVGLRLEGGSTDSASESVELTAHLRRSKKEGAPTMDTKDITSGSMTSPSDLIDLQESLAGTDPSQPRQPTERIGCSCLTLASAGRHHR
jgi:hypothetical protein